MVQINFEWDENKNQENIKKHKVSFDEAKTAFSDDCARIISDPDHSEDEERFILLGESELTRLLVVVHCYKKNDEIIRIISARPANKYEKKQYMGFYYER